MNDLVVDASVLVDALSGTTVLAKELRDRLARAHCHAPHLVDAEVGQALRRKERRGELEADAALAALRLCRRAIHERYPLSTTLAELAWSMRENVTYYDGLYVGLAAVLRVPLLTLDARLAGAPNLPCDVELVASDM